MELRLSYRAYRRTFLRSLRTAHGDWTHREGFILRLDGGGRTAYGDVAPLPDFGTETVGEADALLARLAETPAMELPAGHPCCAFALSAAKRSLIARDAALTEAQAKKDGAVPTAYPVAGLLPGGPSALKSATAKLAAGYRNLKWKIGVLPVEEEIAVASKLLAALPPGVRIRLDGNAGLSADALARWLDFLGGFSDQVEFMEQPLPPGAEAEMAAMAASSSVPIALDESLNGPDGGEWLRPGAWAGPLVIKPLLMGDLSALEARLRPVATQLVYSSAFETVFGLRAALDLIAQLPTSPHALGFDTTAAFEDPLSPGFAGPRLEMEQLTSIELDQRWNHLPHLT